MIQTQPWQRNERNRGPWGKGGESSAVGLFDPENLNLTFPPTPVHTHTFPDEKTRAERRMQSLWAAGNLSTWHFEELQRLLSVKGTKPNHVEKHIFLWKRSLKFLEALNISVLLRVSVKWATSLRRPTAGDLWETPQVSSESCFGLGGSHELPCTQRLVEVWH